MSFRNTLYVVRYITLLYYLQYVWVRCYKQFVWILVETEANILMMSGVIKHTLSFSKIQENTGTDVLSAYITRRTEEAGVKRRPQNDLVQGGQIETQPACVHICEKT